MSGQKRTKKSKKPRSSVKYPALNPRYNLKSRQDLIEVDYINQLSESEKEWLNSFNEEYVNANFKHKGKKIHKKEKHKKDAYSRNNARNRDILTRERAAGTINYIEDLKGKQNHMLMEESSTKLDDLNKPNYYTDDDREESN